MKVVNPSNQSLEEKAETSWQKLKNGFKKGFVTATSVLALLGIAAGMEARNIDASQYKATAKKQTQITNQNTNKDKNKDKKGYIIKPVSVVFYDKTGKEYVKPEFTGLKEAHFLENAISLKPGESFGISSPKTSGSSEGKLPVDILIQHQNSGKYLINEATGRRAFYANRIIPAYAGMKPGEIYNIWVVAEKGKKIKAGVGMKVFVEPRPEQQVVEKIVEVPHYVVVEKEMEAEPKGKEPERKPASADRQPLKRQPADRQPTIEERATTPDEILRELQEDMAPLEEHEQKQRKKREQKPSVIEIKGGYVLEHESGELKNDTDPERTSKGLLVEGLIAGEDYQLWGTFLNLKYDDQILVPGGANIKNVFSEANLGGEIGYGPFIAGLEYIRTNNEWVPTRTPLWAPPMHKYVFNGIYGGAGIKLGNFNESFLEALYYYGKGNLSERINRPGANFMEDLKIDSQSITEQFVKVHGKINIGNLYLEGIYTSGKYSPFNGTRETFGGKGMVSLGLLSDSLKNMYLGLLYHESKAEDNNMKFDNNFMAILGMLRF